MEIEDGSVQGQPSLAQHHVDAYQGLGNVDAKFGLVCEYSTMASSLAGTYRTESSQPWCLYLVQGIPGPRSELPR
jgi:hypothetical protein